MRHSPRQNAPTTPLRRFDAAVQSMAEGLALQGLTPAQIERALIEAGVAPADRPSRRTIQRLVQAVRVHDRSGPWSLGDAEGDEAPLILPVLRAYLQLSSLQARKSSRSHFITKAEARWIVRIRRTAPDLHPFDVYLLARAYLGRETRNQVTHDLDALLAYQPWDETPRSIRDHEYTLREAYERGVRQGTIPPAPPFLMDRLAGIRWSPQPRETNLYVAAKYGHDPDAWELASVRPDDEDAPGDDAT